MPLPIRDYGLIGNGHTAALVGCDGSIDWLCMPRFDSGACLAALLGSPEHGRWLIAPVSRVAASHRRYRDGSIVLETDLECDGGAVRLTDFMVVSDERWDVVRIVEGLRGDVRMHSELIVRLDYGSVVPWVRRAEGRQMLTAGRHTLELHSRVASRGVDMKTVAEFDLRAGERISFVLNYRPSWLPPPPALDTEAALQDALGYWRDWSGRSTYRGRWRDAVQRSLITLKALIYQPTGGIVAAPTTSLPEQAGGVRNWDYRYCWLRDATYTLNALLLAGYRDEAIAWREWLLRAVAGSPEDMQILYSVLGDRWLDERELEWLPGYGNAAPVRVGNAASRQFQLDVYGEVMDSLHLARAAGIDPAPHAWEIQRVLLKFLEAHWQDPDEGIWEIRGPRQQFTHSKVMAWVAFDRAVKAVERFGFDGPVDTWREVRAQIHEQVCTRGYDAGRNTFVQHYGSKALDASLLLIPLVGFLPPDDARVRGTIERIQRELVVEGLVQRYSTETNVDNLPPGEGTFLPCTFWLVDCLSMTGRRDEAEALFERLLGLRNDLGLLSEEYEPRTQQMLGNFPQALTHMALIHSAHLLSMPEGQAERSSEEGERPANAA